MPLCFPGAQQNTKRHRVRHAVSEEPHRLALPSSVGWAIGRSATVSAMITAIVFVKADVARIPEVAEQIAAIDGVSEVYSVTGQIDLITLVRVRDHEDVAAVVADKLNKVPGVTSTETHIAFRAYSQHDLESAFSLGLD